MAVCTNGSCGYTQKPDGTLIEQGDSMDCRDKVCMNGSTENQANGLNCNDTNTDDCLIPRCDFDGDCSSQNQSKAPEGTPCKKNDVPGTCNDEGFCVTNP